MRQISFLSRLKGTLLIVKRTGVGKTSLIKSVVQLCEDIIHVDSVISSAHSSQPSHGAQDSVSEIYASTKPYPEWWSSMEESRILRRRKSMGDSVLERNICFVDTSNSAKPATIIDYAEQQLTNAMSCVDRLSSEFSALLSGRGASQVDVILYLISKGIFSLLTKTLMNIAEGGLQIPCKTISNASANCPNYAT